MESFKKLREYARDYGGTLGAAVRMRQIADEIEAELAERYMELPLDADGVPIYVGEVCYDTDTAEPFEVSSIEWNGVCWSAWSKPEQRHIYNHVTHVKPRTVEDVLTDFAEEWLDVRAADSNALIAKYAEELRGMMGVEP